MHFNLLNGRRSTRRFRQLIIDSAVVSRNKGHASGDQHTTRRLNAEPNKISLGHFLPLAVTETCSIQIRINHVSLNVLGATIALLFCNIRRKCWV